MCFRSSTACDTGRVPLRPPLPLLPSAGRDARDPGLIGELRDRLLQPPSQLPYQLLQPEVADVSVGQAQLVLEVLGNKVPPARAAGWGGLSVRLLTGRSRVYAASVLLVLT